MKARSVVLTISLVLAACGDDEAPTTASDIAATPPVATTVPSTVPETTATTPTTAAATTTASPDTTGPPPTVASTAPSVAPTSGVAVVYTSSGDARLPWLPVGWWDGSAWGSVEWPSPDVPLPAPSFGAVSVASLELADGPFRDVTDFENEEYGCIDLPGLPSIVLDAQLPELDRWYGYRAVAVTADWDVQPRPVRAVGLDVPEYQQLGESLVEGGPEVDPTLGDVTQVVRADLDGDGVEEVFFTFEYAATDTGLATAGDFSILVARYPETDGTVVDEVLFRHVVQSPVEYPSLDRGRVVAIADVNGDGSMEVAVGVVYWEGASVTLYELGDGRLHEVMSSACGV